MRWNVRNCSNWFYNLFSIILYSHQNNHKLRYKLIHKSTNIQCPAIHCFKNPFAQHCAASFAPDERLARRNQIKNKHRHICQARRNNCAFSRRDPDGHPPKGLASARLVDLYAAGARLTAHSMHCTQHIRSHATPDWMPTPNRVYTGNPNGHIYETSSL